MRKWVKRGAVVVVLVALVVAGLKLAIRPRGPSAPAPEGSSPDSDTPAFEPVPNLSLQVNGQTELEVVQGAPLILTARVANPYAANAVASQNANRRFASWLRERVAQGALSSAEAQPMLDRAGASTAVRTFRLSAGERGWQKFVHFEVRRAGGSSERLTGPTWVAAGSPATGLDLDATSVVEADYALAPEAAAGLALGELDIVAVLDVPAEADAPRDVWRGRIASEPVRLKVGAALAAPSPEQLAQLQLQYARYYSALKDWPRAIEAAEQAVTADPTVIRAHIAIGRAKEARDDLPGARSAFVEAYRLFAEQYPDSSEEPLYLIMKVAELDRRIGAR